jgi:hypothetical protein
MVNNLKKQVNKKDRGDQQHDHVACFLRVSLSAGHGRVSSGEIE